MEKDMPRKELLFMSDPVEVDDDEDVREAVFDHVTLAIPAGFGENNVRCVRKSVYAPSRVYSPSIIFPPLHFLRLSPPHLFFLSAGRSQGENCTLQHEYWSLQFARLPVDG